MEPSDFKFKLGEKVKHKLVNFKGIIRGRSQYLTGCNQYGVQNTKVDKEGKPRKWETFDENMIELVNPSKAEKKKKKGGEVPGGPTDESHIPKSQG